MPDHRKHHDLPAFLGSQRGFTGAEKALLTTVALALVGTVGALVSRGSTSAANDAARVLSSGQGEAGAVGQAAVAMKAAGDVAPAGSPQAAGALLKFSSDFQAPPTAAPPPRAAPPVAAAAAASTLSAPVTAAELKRIVPQMSSPKAQLYAPLINQAMQEYGITTKAREAAFLGQIAEETDGFNTLQEYASGAEYNGRKDLGNTQPGDGPRFKGRGAIQLTGRANYAAASKVFGIDLVSNPVQAASPQLAFRIAGWYWQSHGLNSLADQGQFSTITRRINGGLNGESTRVLYWQRAQAAGL